MRLLQYLKQREATERRGYCAVRRSRAPSSNRSDIASGRSTLSNAYYTGPFYLVHLLLTRSPATNCLLKYGVALRFPSFKKTGCDDARNRSPFPDRTLERSSDRKVSKRWRVAEIGLALAKSYHEVPDRSNLIEMEVGGRLCIDVTQYGFRNSANDYYTDGAMIFTSCTLGSLPAFVADYSPRGALPVRRDQGESCLGALQFRRCSRLRRHCRVNHFRRHKRVRNRMAGPLWREALTVGVPADESVIR